MTASRGRACGAAAGVERERAGPCAARRSGWSPRRLQRRPGAPARRATRAASPPRPPPCAERNPPAPRPRGPGRGAAAGGACAPRAALSGAQRACRRAAVWRGALERSVGVGRGLLGRAGRAGPGRTLSSAAARTRAARAALHVPFSRAGGWRGAPEVNGSGPRGEVPGAGCAGRLLSRVGLAWRGQGTPPCPTLARAAPAGAHAGRARPAAARAGARASLQCRRRTLPGLHSEHPAPGARQGCAWRAAPRTCVAPRIRGMVVPRGVGLAAEHFWAVNFSQATGALVGWGGALAEVKRCALLVRFWHHVFSWSQAAGTGGVCMLQSLRESPSRGF